MKRYINRIIPIILAGLSLASCNKQLEEYNPNGITAENTYTTPAGAEAAVNAAYTFNRYFYGKEEGVGLFEAGSDIWTSGIGDQKPDLTTYNGIQTNQAWVTTLWKQCYAGINTCNTALYYLNDAGVSATRKPVLEAELRFMRAWYYWHLVESFGPIPFTFDPTLSMVTAATRTPVDTVYNKGIIPDLEFAVANLPKTTTDYGRVTKPAAEAFLSRICLYRGKNREAINYAESVINNYGFKLLSKYSGLWDMANLKNSEVIWAVNYSSNIAYNAGSNVLHSAFLFPYQDEKGMIQDITNGYSNNRYMPTLYLLGLYNEKDDSRYAASFKDTWYANNSATLPSGMKLGDTAVYISKYSIDASVKASKVYRIYDINDMYNTDGKSSDRKHVISLKKFDDPTRLTAKTTESPRDAFLIRLAEMYLIAAEGELNIGKGDSAAYFVNEVRKRAAIPGHENAMQITASDVTLDFLLDERAREFAGEQIRWFDLKRTGKLIERVTSHNPDAASYIKDFHVLRPIPDAQMSTVTNKNEFLQNPGYF